MARAPDKRIEQAKAMYLKGLKMVDIAAKLELPEGTIRRWKCTHKWDGERSDKNSERSDRKKGGQPENKNAVKTGEFETLFFDTLNQEEKTLIEVISSDKERLLLQEIKLLTVREHRMLKRIESLKEAEKLMESEEIDGEEPDGGKAPPGMTVVKYTSGMEKGKQTELKEYEGILGQIQAVEDALTRVQARKQKAIEALHKFGYDDARLELDAMKFEMELLKQGGTEDE
ncbi:MAG: terminase [Lachnospiraceae bacterium]|nr:terminase [Lachnospiraceae bacterium]